MIFLIFSLNRKNRNHIGEVLMYVRSIFHQIDSNNPKNEVAANLYDNNIEEFKKKVTECVDQSRSCIYDPPNCDDPHAIRFTEWDNDKHAEARKKLFNPSH